MPSGRGGAGFVIVTEVEEKGAGRVSRCILAGEPAEHAFSLINDGSRDSEGGGQGRRGEAQEGAALHPCSIQMHKIDKRRETADHGGAVGPPKVSNNCR